MAGERWFSPAEREVLYDVIAARRDIRAYRPDPVPGSVLARMLAAAHRAPSVGFMQPWDFLCVSERAVRERIYHHFREANQRAAAHFSDERAALYSALKLQGLLDAPLNLVVTCDHERAGPHVLGRDTMRETDAYSTCLAVQNLWLAARVEGVGVGWMSIMEPEVVKAILGLPARVSIIAYLTVGYAVEFPRTPMLQSVGWRERLPLSAVVHHERWGEPYAPVAVGSDSVAAEPEAPFGLSAPRTAPAHPDVDSAAQLRARLDALTKPPGSLGALERVALQLSACQRRVYPQVKHRRLLLFAGDHGVAAERVSAYRREVTAKMVYQFIAGGGAVNAFARQYGVEVGVVDVGVDHDFGGATGLSHCKVRRGTRNWTREAAMTAGEYDQALAAGRAQVERLGETDVLALGELGIGNSTSAAALACALLSLSPEKAVGAGTGVGDAGLARKRAAVTAGLALHAGQGTDLPQWLRGLGGYEIIALIGAILAAAERGVPVVLDGLITGVAALAAARLAPEVAPWLVAAHRSPEPAHGPVLEALGLRPLLELGLRLGEGSGAVLAMGLLESACRIARDMRTFEEAGIEHPREDDGPLAAD